MRWRRECEGQALHGLSETPSKCTTRPFLNSAIVIWRPDQVSQLHNTLGCFIVSQSAVTRQRRLGEQIRRHTQERSALQLTGCKVLCFSPKRRDDWGDPLSSEEDKMSGVQQRLKLKQTPIDTWSLKEHLTLASAVLKWVSFFNLSSRNQLSSIIRQYESKQREDWFCQERRPELGVGVSDDEAAWGGRTTQWLVTDSNEDASFCFLLSLIFLLLSLISFCWPSYSFVIPHILFCHPSYPFCYPSYSFCHPSYSLLSSLISFSRFKDKNCALQYNLLLEKADIPTRKRGEKADSSETPAQRIVNQLAQERIAELKIILGEISTTYF